MRWRPCGAMCSPPGLDAWRSLTFIQALHGIAEPRLRLRLRGPGFTERHLRLHLRVLSPRIQEMRGDGFVDLLIRVDVKLNFLTIIAHSDRDVFWLIVASNTLDVVVQ